MPLLKLILHTADYTYMVIWKVYCWIITLYKLLNCSNVCIWQARKTDRCAARWKKCYRLKLICRLLLFSPIEMMILAEGSRARVFAHSDNACCTVFWFFLTHVSFDTIFRNH
jgi:hypothetical protein